MADGPAGGRPLDVLRRKRDATRYQVLVQIADRQPAVSQREIAEAIGVTAQAVSEYVGGLVDDGYVRKLGRGRYEITKEGVDWLLTRTDELRALAEYVTTDVIGRVDVEAAIATGPVHTGEAVVLSMRDGVLHATPGAEGDATAVAVTDADAGAAVGVTDFEGLLDFDPGRVTILPVASVDTEDRAPPDPDRLRDAAGRHDLVAVAGTEALAAVRAAGLEPDVRFGTPPAIAEAAARGCAVLLVAVEPAVSAHTDRLREAGLGYEVAEEAATRH